jgi:hypothetical protein
MYGFVLISDGEIKIDPIDPKSALRRDGNGVSIECPAAI